MKNTNKLLVVLLALAILVSGIAVTTLTTNAIDVTVDNTQDVIATVKGSDIAGDGDGGNATAYSRDEEAGTFSFNGDCGNFYGIYLKGVEAGVYKVAYYLTIDNVTGGDRIRFKPYGGDVYYNVQYNTLINYEGMKIMVVAVINATGDFEVGGWPATGLYGTIDKVEIAKADYDFGANSGDYLLIEEGIAHDIPGGYTQPSAGQWTPSTMEVPATTTVLNTQAWTFANNSDNYKALFGDGAHGTNGDTIKATVAAGTGLTARDCPATGAPSMNLNADGYVIKYTGVIVAENSGWYQLAAYKIDNGYVAYVGGEKVFDYGKWDNWFDSGRLMYCGDNFYMEAGVKYSYEAYYIEQGGGDAIEPVVLVDGYNRSFATAGISFYADQEADDATVTIDNSAPALEATSDTVLYYQDFEGFNMTEDSQAVDVGIDKVAGKTDITIEAVLRPLNIRRDGGLMTNNSGLMGIGEQDNTGRYILLGFMEGGALKVGVKASGDSNIERQTERGMLNNNKWVTLKYVFTANAVKTYVDGILVCENDISNIASIGDFTGKFLIGDITSWPDPGFRGQVGEIRVTTPAPEAEGGATVTGTYVGTDDWGNSPLTVTFNESTVTFDYNHPMMGPSSSTFDYAIIDGEMVLYDDGGNVLNPLAGRITLTDGVPTAADYNGNAYTLVPGEPGGEEGGEDGGEESDVIQLNWPMPGGFSTNELAPNAEEAYAASGFNGYDLIIEDADAYVIHNGQTYTAENGVVKVTLSAFPPMMPAEFVIGNNGSEAKVFHVTLSREIPLGDWENPEVIEENGNYIANIEADGQVYYYTWTAPADGTVTITMNGDGWLYTVNNLTSGVYGDEHNSGATPVVSTESLTVSAGDEIQIMVITYNPEEAWSVPEGEVDWNFAFQANAGGNEGTEDEPTDKPVTGVAAATMALLLAGAAAMGGLKLRKR